MPGPTDGAQLLSRHESLLIARRGNGTTPVPPSHNRGTDVPMTEFTPLASLFGGALIGAASVLLMAVRGRIAGISGIAVRLFPPYLDGELGGRAAFIAGLILAPLLVLLLTGGLPVQTITGGPWLLTGAGLLVGFGAVWGSGCTSGHGVCGLSLFSTRSVVAVATFMATAILTVLVTRHLL